MKANLVRAAAGATALAASLAGAQTYSTYPSYGYSGAQGSVVRCESINSRSNFCRADTRGGVQVYRQLSRKDCIRGRNWRVVSGGIVVDDGCRADFAVASGYASTQGGYIGTDRYGRPIYSERAGTYNGGYTTTDPYGRPVYDARGPYGNGGYTIDRYGNRVYVGGAGSTSGGYYSTDRYGNRVYVPYSGTSSGGYYSTDRYGNRVFVPTSGSSNDGYYTTDRYGNRVFVPSSGYGRVYDDDYDESDDTYRRNVELGPPVYGGGTYSPPTTTTTYGADVIYCQPSAMGRTYCGDRTRTYTLHHDANANCVLNQTYGRDSYGTWVSGSCSMRMETNGY
jgi:hypothetical protein